MNHPRLIRELIKVPERVHRGDFVLRLTEGIQHPAETLASYVVTPQLLDCFEDALSFVRSALEHGQSKATYLHGSFGSGKSHFMAVLHLILQGEPSVGRVAELAELTAGAGEWLPGKRFLLVPYHMIGAASMEAGILGGYVEHLRRIHPEAPPPGVHLGEGLLRDARQLRARIGDPAFFAQLAAGAPGGWGQLEGGWDAARFEVAASRLAGDHERQALVSRLTQTLFTSYTDVARGSQEAFLSLDHGLSVISRHARDLGYDGLILFLDELILWLASHAADLAFVHREGQKLSKLVEAERADRPIPIISFVARQRDLTELVGEHVIGSSRLNFSDALKHWEGRFHRITLEDRNLPEIAHRRVLKPINEAARTELEAAYDRSTGGVRREVIDTLLTSKYDRDVFRKVFPFSPALIDTLVGVSSVLQRERTALKVLMQLLVDQRETLRAGDLVPVGDLFDVIAHGDEAFNEELRRHFNRAQSLYHERLLPLLERRAGVRREELEQRPWDDVQRTAFRGEDRLVKTLLLAALVPGVESLQGLTAARLAALNHGSVRTPIPGHEAQRVAQLCREWAAEVGEVRVGDEAGNPTVQLQLSDVDTDSILAKAIRQDTPGNRISMVRRIVFEQLGVEHSRPTIGWTIEVLWRGTRRQAVLEFENVRLTADVQLSGAGDDWSLVVDFPFDEAGHTPTEDVDRIRAYLEVYPAGARTLVWLPQFFSLAAGRDLGRLVVLDHVLAGERFDSFADHLSPQDRAQARALLDNQRSQLRQRVRDHIEAAYGVHVRPASVDASYELAEQFQSLEPTFQPQPPVGANLRQAMEHLLAQALAHQFPAHPAFPVEVKPALVRTVWEQVREATRTVDGWIDIDKKHRALLSQLAEPLGLGRMAEQRFGLAPDWREHFTRHTAAAGAHQVTVAQLRTWIDLPTPRGLGRELQDLVILLYAEQTNHSIDLHGGPVDEIPGKLPDAAVLRSVELPGESEWATALERAQRVFGRAPSALRTAGTVARLSTELAAEARAARDGCREYVVQLEQACQKAGVDAARSARVKSARSALSLVDVLAAEQDATPRIRALATATLPVAAAAVGTALRLGGQLAGWLRHVRWGVIDGARAQRGSFPAAIERIEARVNSALCEDEAAVPLQRTLESALTDAEAILAGLQRPPGPSKLASPERPYVIDPRTLPAELPAVVHTEEAHFTSIAQAAKRLAQLEAEAAGRAISLMLRWSIEDEA